MKFYNKLFLTGLACAIAAILILALSLFFRSNLFFKQSLAIILVDVSAFLFLFSFGLEKRDRSANATESTEKQEQNAEVLAQGDKKPVHPRIYFFGQKARVRKGS